MLCGLERGVSIDADVLAHLPGAVVAVDLDGRIRHWSSGAEGIYGWTAGEALGRPIRELILIGEHERADAVRARTHAGSEWVGEFGAVHKDGRRLVVWVSNAPLRDATGVVVGIVGVSLDMTQHATEQAERSAQLQAAHDRAGRLADRQSRLMRVSEALGRALTPRQVVEVVLEQGVQALGADAGAIVGVADGALEVLGSIGYEDAVVRSCDGLRLEARTPLTDVIRTRRPLLLDGRSEPDAPYPRRLDSPGTESFAGIPLEIDGRTVGVMALSALRPSAFPAEDLEFLVTLGRQCAQALERGRLFAAERDARRRMSFLAMASARLAASLDYRTTLAAVVALAVPAAGDWCALHLVDELGVPRLESVSHRDPDLQELLVEVLQRYPPDSDAGGPIGTVLAGGRTVHLESVGEADLRRLAEDAWHLDALRRLGLGSTLVVPLRVAGRTLGALSVTSSLEGRYQPADVQLVEDLAQRMATAVDNALRYGQERRTALTLQRSLLPSRLPVLPGLSVAHRYLPGTAGAEVGGDWYDIIPLTGGRVGLVIGDVMGRGIAAAAVMGQLRATVRACALAEDSPAAVLGLVDAAMSSLEQTSLTTCLYAVFDPATRRLRLASSGHLPPLLVHADGGGEYVELDPGPPLGVGSARPSEVEVDVAEGAVLLLFTDGLVEGRNQPVEDGMHVLRGAVSDGRGTDASNVEALCDELLRAMGRDGRPDDDSALLAVWTGCTSAAAGGDADVHLHLAGHLSEVARARRLTVQVAGSLGVDLDDAALLVTEVATNALQHGGPGVDLWLRAVQGGGLRVEIVDGRAESLPRMRTPDSDDEGGRGLLLVSALARAWGSERLSAGKCVWFELGPAVQPVLVAQGRTSG